jgi:hypothetical protein
MGKHGDGSHASYGEKEGHLHAPPLTVSIWEGICNEAQKGEGNCVSNVNNLLKMVDKLTGKVVLQLEDKW